MASGRECRPIKIRKMLNHLNLFNERLMIVNQSVDYVEKARQIQSDNSRGKGRLLRVGVRWAVNKLEAGRIQFLNRICLP